jgi:hypothetical protein
MMKNQCGQTELPASHDCCKKASSSRLSPLISVPRAFISTFRNSELRDHLPRATDIRFTEIARGYRLVVSDGKVVPECCPLQRRAGVSTTMNVPQTNKIQTTRRKERGLAARSECLP